MAVASYSGAPVERVPPVASRRRNGALVGAAWALAGLGLVALAVLEHERSKAEQGHGSMLCGTFFTCADALIKEHKGVFGDRKVAVKVPPKHMLIGIDTPVDPQEETGSQVPHPPPNDSQNFFSFGGEARDTIEQPSSIGRCDASANILPPLFFGLLDNCEPPFAISYTRCSRNTTQGTCSDSEHASPFPTMRVCVASLLLQKEHSYPDCYAQACQHNPKPPPLALPCPRVHLL